MGQDAVGYLVKRLDACFKQQMDAALLPHALSASTYAALHHLHFIGPMSSSELARCSWVTPQTMHRLVQTLKQRGFVVVAAVHGRTATLALTDAGRQTFEAALVDVSAIEARMVRDLCPEQVVALRAMLHTCREALEDD